jgi:hypothetical protein
VIRGDELTKIWEQLTIRGEELTKIREESANMREELALAVWGRRVTNIMKGLAMGEELTKIRGVGKKGERSYQDKEKLAIRGEERFATIWQ